MITIYYTRMCGLNFSYKCFVKINFVVDNNSLRLGPPFFVVSRSQVKHFEQCAYDEPKANPIF